MLSARFRLTPEVCGYDCLRDDQRVENDQADEEHLVGNLGVGRAVSVDAAVRHPPHVITVPSAKPAMYRASTHRAHGGNAAHFRPASPAPAQAMLGVHSYIVSRAASGCCRVSIKPAARPNCIHRLGAQRPPNRVRWLHRVP